MIDEWESDPLKRAEQELREAEHELDRWKQQQERATEPGQQVAARHWVSYYGQQRDRWRTRVAALRRERAVPGG